MESSSVSRRSFVFGGIGLAAAGIAASQVVKMRPTAGQVIDRIKANVGIPWQGQTVDRIVAGTADTPIQGIATTMMATLDVVQRAAAAGKNLVITHEPTFYSHEDATDELRGDPTFQYKLDFIRKNNMVVFRFHDHWHRRNPDGIAFGMARELGWEKNADPQNPRLFSFPSIPLADFVDNIKARLKPHTMRVLGDPSLRISKAIANWGYVSQLPGIALLARPDVNVMVGGEAREWEVVEYAQDSISAGNKKALVLLGHVVSEQAGMKYCAEWLKPLVSEVPIDFVAASDPFWST